MPINYTSKQLKRQSTPIYLLEEYRTGISFQHEVRSGKHRPCPTVYSTLLGHMPSSVLSSKSDRPILRTFVTMVPAAFLDLVQPGQCDTQRKAPLASKPPIQIPGVTMEASPVAKTTGWPALCMCSTARPSNRAPAGNPRGLWGWGIIQISSPPRRRERRISETIPSHDLLPTPRPHPLTKVPFYLYASFLCFNYWTYSFHKFLPHPLPLAASLWLQQAPLKLREGTIKEPGEYCSDSLRLLAEKEGKNTKLALCITSNNSKHLIIQ